MYSRNKEVVRLAHKAICDVDDERSRDWLRLYPLARLVQHLETTTVILRYDSEALYVGVCSDA